ncbi:MAG: 4Fe-4S dicluster domain-containing protein [bacterium]|nr:4Fe-4S dicluster domain-containing protein [bacterium]
MKEKNRKYAMVIDTKVCVGCGACVVACKTENEVPEGLHRVWVVEELSGSFPNLNLEIRSERCNHCSNSPCVSACPTKASHFVEGTNIVDVDKGKCTGCKACMAACPYNARFVMPEGYIGKCSFCRHRLAKGEKPACASVCPAHAIHFGDLNNPQSEVSKLLGARKYKTIIPEAGTEPNIYYLV